MLFSNGNRIAKVCCLFTALFILCVYSYWEGTKQEVTVEKCLSNPLQYDGKEIILEDHILVLAVFKNQFEIYQGGSKMMVTGTADGLTPNDNISLKAIFHRQGYGTLQELYIHKLRKHKIIISLGAVIFVVGLFLKRYRFSLKKLCFVERIGCRI
jgi:hypothetical protein